LCLGAFVASFSGLSGLGHCDLFEPALVRLVWFMLFAVSDLELEAINTSGVNSVWARDLGIGAWNFGIIFSQIYKFN